MAQEEGDVTKIEFGETRDFKFNAAYEAYSRSFDKSPGTDEKKRLNEAITRLFNREISYPRFYDEINRYLDKPDGKEFRRARIKGQRKRAYRRDQQEKLRIKRHKR